MPQTKNNLTSANASAASIGYQAKLVHMAEALRGTMDAAECRRSQRSFWVWREVSWTHLKAEVSQPTSGNLVGDAIADIERDNPGLKGARPGSTRR